MLKLIKRWANRHEIAELQLELKGLEARLPSMEDKVFRSRGTAEMWEEQEPKRCFRCLLLERLREK